MHLSLLPGQGKGQGRGPAGPGGGQGGPGGGPGREGGASWGPPKLLSGALPPWTPPGGVWVPGICRQWAPWARGGQGGG